MEAANASATSAQNFTLAFTAGEHDREDFSWLTSVSLLIFAAALGAGLAPLAFVKVTWMNKVTALGAGLCVGASLGLIIPEGFSVLYETQQEHKMPHGLGGLALTSGLMFFFILEQVMFPQGHGHGYTNEHERFMSGPYVDDKGSDEDDIRVLQRPSKQYKALSATFMMVCHAVADGLVLGTAAAADHHEISAVVAIAMIAHKIPASFSLGSFLVSMKLTTYNVTMYMMTFAAASPIGAFLCYFIQLIVPKNVSAIFISILMLFSGGSVLYTACFHMLPEAFNLTNSYQKHDRSLTSMVALGALVATLFAFIPHDDD